MKNDRSDKLNAYKSDHKSNQKQGTSVETGIPNTDVLGMQQVNQASADKIHTSASQNTGGKTGKNNLKKGRL
jgi:hypothetical protein